MGTSLANPETTGTHDGVAEPDCPVVLQQDQGGGRAVRDVFQDIPPLDVTQRVQPLGTDFRARDRTSFDTLLTVNTQPDQFTDECAELDGLVAAQVAQMSNL